MTPRGEVPENDRSTMTLTDDLQTINGVGPAKAEEIVDIVADHDQDGSDAEPDDLDHAIEQARRGNEREVIAFLESLR